MPRRLALRRRAACREPGASRSRTRSRRRRSPVSSSASPQRSGGVRSAAIVWLVAVPLEALLSGSPPRGDCGERHRRGGRRAHRSPRSSRPRSRAASLGRWRWRCPCCAITAIGHAAALAMQHARSESGRRAMIRARDARDRSLLQVIDDLVTWHDSNGHVLNASGGATKLLGVPAASLAGRGLLSRVHVSDRPAFLKAISDAAANDRAGRGAVPPARRLHRREGAGEGPRSAGRQVIWAETRAHRIEPLGGEAQHHAVVAVTRDVSEHRRHADELERARRQAETPTPQRATSSRRSATNCARRSTPSSASPRCSPRTGRCRSAPSAGRSMREIVHDFGMHLLAVVNTLLDMSKIEAGQFDFVPEPFDIAPAGA